MPEAQLDVTHVESGQRLTIPASDYQANPAAYELVPGQAITAVTGTAPMAAPVTEALAKAGALPEQATPAQRAEFTKQQLAEELFEGPAEKVKAIARGVGHAATLGLSRLAFRPDDPFERTRQDLRDRAVGDYEAGAELVGDIGLAILSGGTSTLAGAARLTAPGIIARGGRAIAGEVGERALTRVALGGAYEAAATSAGQYLAASALRKEPLSVSGLMGHVGTSALLGGGATGVLGLAGRGLSKLGSRGLEEAATHGPDELARILQGAEEGALVRAADDLATRAPRKAVPIRKLFSRKGRRPELSRRGAVELIEQVQGRLGRAQAGQDALQDAVRVAEGAGVPLSDDLVAATRMALDDHRLAASAAAEWTPRIAEEVEQAAAGQAVKVGVEGGEALRALDMADRDLAKAFGDLRANLPEPATLAPAPAGLLTRALDGMGVVELAQSAGMRLPDLDRIPGIGPLVSGLAKVRAIYRAAGRLGLVPGSQITDAAQYAARSADVFGRVMSSVASGKIAARLPGAVRRVMKLMTAAQVNQQRLALQEATPERVTAAVESQYGELPEDMRTELVASAQRRIDYLREIAPQAPPGFESVPLMWSPTPMQIARFGEVSLALDMRTAVSVERLFAGDWRYPLDVVAGVQAVYPDIYQQTQAELIGNQVALVRNNPRSTVGMWARWFEVPILPELLPSYSLPPTPQPEAGGAAGAPVPRLPRPSTRSSVAETAEARPHIRRG